MSKNKTLYICNECGAKTAKWYGKCMSCGTWGSLEEVKDIPKSILKSTDNMNTGNVKKISEIDYIDEYRYKTGIEEFDRLLGGGLIKGEVVLITGNPGIGKSTLLLQVADKYSEYLDLEV